MDKNTVSNNINLVSKYWKKKILNREKVFGGHQKQNSLPCVVINANELNYFNSLTNNNPIAQYTVISAIYSFLLKKLINEFDGYLVSKYKNQYNSLLLSFPIDLNTSFKEYLQKVKYEILETLKHSVYNNELVYKKADINDLSILSSYSININSDSKLDCNGVLFDITINDRGDIEIHASYLEGFIKNEIVERLVKYFKYFVVNLEINIAFNLSEYTLLSEKEKHQLLVNFNATGIAYPKDKTIVDLFEEQVGKTPYNVAVVFEESKLTYEKLNEKANQLANYISSKHTINSGDIIGVFLPKSDIGIISLLAILKLGAVYLPIDTNYPQERIDYLIKDSGLKLLITDNVKLDFDKCDSVVVNEINFEDDSSDNINTSISSKDLAYIIYTSGSTGQPKGVMVEHTSNVNMSLDQIKSFDITESDKVVWFASVAFDASISEIMMSLYSGATLCIPTEETIKDKKEFVRFLKETKSRVVTFPPSYLGLLSQDDISGLRCIITAGESANATKAIAVVGSGIDYYNAYGPTECAVCVSIYKVSENDIDKKIIPIGKPIANTQVYILDKALQPLPVGVSGKLYVSGAGVARGYLNKPELTNEKFISNPFIEGTRMYDTGDLGCWLSDGNIEFLGRKDSQVKIRGYRIELGEIENTISHYSEDIKQVVVEVKENNQEKVLVAYFVSTTYINKSALRSFLQEKLPEYMVPSFYVVLAKLPLTPNGKIDRKALPSTTGDDIIRKEYVAPRNKTEESLVLIWQEVLGIEKIGITDNFFELGGHSLIMSQVINRIHKQLGKTVSFKAFFASPTIKSISVQLQDNKYTSIPKISEAESYPLTASQSRLWILSQLEGGSLAYNMPAAVKLTGAIDANKFEESFRRLIHRHEILRTYFKTNEEGDARQFIVPTEQVNFKIAEKDYSVAENQGEAIADYLQERNNEPFDLEQAPLVRASLIKLKEEEYVFFLSLHHIIGDGWSIELLISEVVKTYNALTQGKEINLPELSIQYKDYAVWLNEELQEEKHQASEQYWLQQFEGELPVLDLPSFRTRPLVQTYNGNNVTHQFSIGFLEKLKVFSKEHDVTLFMTVMAGINALLHRYTGQDDIVIGTPIAGREHPDLENQMGLYLNTLAIRTQLKEESTFLDVVAIQKETLLSAYDHQNYPFDALVGKLNLKRDTSRSALFDVLVVLQNQGQLNNLNTEELINLEISSYEFNNKTSQFDISFTFVEKEGLELTIEYNTDIYEGYLIERMFLHFENLLIESLERPESLIQKVNYLTDKEKQQLLVDFNDTEVIYPKDKTIIDLFEEQAAKTPNNIAVVFEDKELTYKELNEQSNQLAAYLIENYAIEPDDLVGIRLDRSERMMVSIFGILKAGGAYVPMDVNYPQERIDYITTDAKLKLCIDENEFEKFRSHQNSYDKVSLQLGNLVNHLAYCIYTSGSTGKPKGVLNHHAGLYNRLLWMKSYLNVEEKEVFVQKTPYTFDVSVWELILPFITGSSLVIAKPEGHKDVTYLQEVINKEQVTIIHFVPSMLGVFLVDVDKEKCNFLSHIVCSGEELPVIMAQECKEKFPKTQLHNLYGPTEAAIDVTAINLSKIDVIPQGVSIGKPIANTSIYIVNNSLELQPCGVPGELLISGIQVAKGYLNLSELTKDRFIADPFRKGYQVYRTGDIAQWQPDGSIRYMGRIDNQVKIRGNRIELGEVENAIMAYGGIQQVVATPKELSGEKVLVAYYLLERGIVIDKAALRNYLQGKLPEYMLPSFYVLLETLPMTSSGKVDKKALPNIVGDDLIRGKYVSPRNQKEEKLVTIWQDILGVEKVGITDNFFELGGHSLVVAQVINRTHKQLGKTVSFKVFFSNPTIKALSKQLQKNEYTPLSVASAMDSYPLTASQNRLWILSQVEGGSLAYNMPAVVNLKGAVNIDKLEKSFKLLIDRHEILRTYFKANEKGEVRQHIVPIERVKFKITEEDFCSVENQETDVFNFLQEKNAEPFDLEQAPLVRASLIKLKENEYVFFLSLHHIIGDGWSIKLLISEVVKTYNGLAQGKEINLPKLRIQYKDYAVWLNGAIQQEEQLASEQYWLDQFKGELPVLELPSFKKRPLVQTYNGDNLTHNFSTEFLEKVKTFSKKQDVTLFMTLMAGINALLHRYTGQDDIIVGTPIAGREHPDLENQIGLYLNTLGIRTQFKENCSFLDLVSLQKESLLSAYDHQNYPFDALIGKLKPKRDTSRSALFDVLVILQNHEQLNNLNTEELLNVEVNGYDFFRKMSQFDLSFTFVEANGLELSIEYNTDIYDSYLIERMFVHFENLLAGLLAQPLKAIQETDYLAFIESQQLILEFNDTAVVHSKGEIILDLFEEQVKKAPGQIAVLFEDVELTYKELNEKANQLANYLRENYTIEPDDLIGIKLERSEQIMIVILGILKSGAAYVPIDVNYPQERIAYIEQDSNCRIVIDEKALEIFTKVHGEYSRENLEKINKPEDLAYIIYTSGTTGNPKGVMIEHRNAVELINWSTVEFDSSKFEIMYAVTSYCFDLSIYEFFYSLSIGKKIRILKNALEIKNYISQEDKILLNTVPSVIRQLLENKIDLKNVSLINMAGEIVPLDIVKKLEKQPIEVRNLYGPSEDTTYSTAYLIKNQEYRSVLIGKPISNTQVYILDDYLHPVSIGVTGKLYVSGAGVTRGYLNQPELTAEKFIDNPFVEGKRMYDTGDLGCWLPDGNVEFLGRKDQQVKLRGYRIELGEIENTILQYSDNLKQVVVEVKGENEEKVLVAYFVTTTDLDKSKLRSFLQNKLSSYMIPSFYIALKKLPLTPNGKIDRKALPAISGDDIIRKEYVAPSNKTEKILVSIWQEVLEVVKIGVTDNFFELGGHSLKAMRLISLIYKEFEVKISISDLFKNVTLEDQAILIKKIMLAYEIDNNDVSDNIETEIFSL